MHFNKCISISVEKIKVSEFKSMPKKPKHKDIVHLIKLILNQELRKGISTIWDLNI